MRDVLRRMARANRPHLHTLTPQQARAAYEAGAGVLEITPAPLPRVEDVRIPARDGHALPARLLCAACAGRGALPVLLYLHRRRLTDWQRGHAPDGAVPGVGPSGRPVRIVSLDYPPRRESNQLPSPPATMRGMLCSGSRSTAPAWAGQTRMAVGGDSAGGTLAAVRLAGARYGPAAAVAGADLPGTCAHQDTDSHFAYAHRLVLERAGIQWFFDNYVRTAADREDWRLPRCWPIDVEGVAPALVCFLAELDPLVERRSAYADMLRMAGVPVELECSTRRDARIQFIKWAGDCRGTPGPCCDCSRFACCPRHIARC